MAAGGRFGIVGQRFRVSQSRRDDPDAAGACTTGAIDVETVLSVLRATPASAAVLVVTDSQRDRRRARQERSPSGLWYEHARRLRRPRPRESAKAAKRGAPGAGQRLPAGCRCGRHRSPRRTFESLSTSQRKQGGEHTNALALRLDTPFRCHSARATALRHRERRSWPFRSASSTAVARARRGYAGGCGVARARPGRVSPENEVPSRTVRRKLRRFPARRASV
jgi:hypothetical protein